MGRVLVIAGTRPEAIKLAPVLRALDPDVSHQLLFTGQHARMASEVWKVFGVKPIVNLSVLRKNSTLTSLSTQLLEKVSQRVQRFAPDSILVQGDTATAAFGALAGFNLRVPVLHLEAGLRSGDLSSPFPEEGYRQIISRLAVHHFAPTNLARSNLLKEGLSASAITVTGNTAVDSVHWTSRLLARNQLLAARVNDSLRRKLPRVDSGKPLVPVTLHRRENTGAALEESFEKILRVARSQPELTFVWPVHPALRRSLKVLSKQSAPNLVFTAPLGYLEMHMLLDACLLVLTDSGGIQEEAPCFGKLTIVLRKSTERPEAVEAGKSFLGGGDGDSLVALTETVIRLSGHPNPHELEDCSNPFGDGRASDRVANFFRTNFRDTLRPKMNFDRSR